MSSVLIAADDFTGANASAVGLRDIGLAAVTLHASATDEQIAQFARRYQATAVTTDSRHLAPSAAAAATSRVVSAGWPAQLVSSRCDSTLRGNMGAEAAAAIATARTLSAGRPVIGLCMPAFPAAGRHTVHGLQRIHGTPLENTELAHDVRSPIADSSVAAALHRDSAAVLGRQIRLKHIDIDDVRSASGADPSESALAARMSAIVGGPANAVGVASATDPAGATELPDVVIADATNDADLLAVARVAIAARPDVLWVGIDAGPGTRALALALGMSLRPPDPDGDISHQEHAVDPDTGPQAASAGDPTSHQPASTVLAVAGSATDLTRAQLHRLIATRCAAVVKPCYATGGDTVDVAATASAVEDALPAPDRDGTDRPKAIVLASALDRDDVRPLGEAETGALTAALGQVTARVLAAHGSMVAGLYTTGGDVTTAVLGALGAAGIEVACQVVPLATAGRIVGGRHEGLPIVTKGGLVGDESTAQACVDALYAVTPGRKDTS